MASMHIFLQLRSMNATSIDAVIFDMDGLLIDSEPLWEKAGCALLQKFGVTLSHAQYSTSTGLRTKEWLQYWFNHFQIEHADIDHAEDDIVHNVIELVKAQGKILPGVPYILQYFQQKGIRIGLATSSPMRLADVVLDLLQIRSYFEVVTSAEHMPFGKPHPQVYMECADALKANPLRCICFEDSFNGMIAAKAAKMKCVVVPAASQLQQARWGAADLKISSLQNFNDLLLRQLQ